MIPKDPSRVDDLFALIGRGRYDRGLEDAVLAHIRKGGDDDKLVVEWPRLFSALMSNELYAPAFRLGEAMLDKLGGFATPQHLMWPWWRRVGRAVSEEVFIHEELERQRAAARGGEFPHWFSYYRAILWAGLGVRNAEVLAEHPRLAALEPARYSWMMQAFVIVKLRLLDYDGAVEVCRRVLVGAPAHWWARCRMAEALLAKGDRVRALAELSRAEKTAAPEDRREVLTWHGEILLWLGEYERALEKFDEAVALGAWSFVYGWRGAARLLSGEAAAALEDLDRAVELDAKDFEALAWRGEARRLQGRTLEAASDLEAVLAGAPHDFWARVNRGLLRDSQDSPVGLEEDYHAVPRDVTLFVAGELGLPPHRPLTREEMRRVLEGCLDRAKGNRRWEDHARQVWRTRRL